MILIKIFNLENSWEPLQMIHYACHFEWCHFQIFKAMSQKCPDPLNWIKGPLLILSSFNFFRKKSGFSAVADTNIFREALLGIQNLCAVT